MINIKKSYVIYFVFRLLHLFVNSGIVWYLSAQVKIFVLHELDFSYFSLSLRSLSPPTLSFSVSLTLFLSIPCLWFLPVSLRSHKEGIHINVMKSKPNKLFTAIIYLVWIKIMWFECWFRTINLKREQYTFPKILPSLTSHSCGKRIM